MDVRAARGIQVLATPTTATTQWVIQQINFPVATSKARVDDQ
jgi:hypothetical protein